MQPEKPIEKEEEVKEKACVAVILGPSCSGKSSLCNTIAGIVVREVGADIQDKELFVWDEDKEIVLIDAPGYEDIEGRDREGLAQIISKVQAIGHVNLIIMCLNASQPRNDDN